MWDKLFDKYKKNQQSKAERISEDLEADFDKFKRQYASIGTSEVYAFISEYFLAKIEINRDVIEEKNPLIEADRIEILSRQAENKAMKSFIEDIEMMKLEIADSQTKTA